MADNNDSNIAKKKVKKKSAKKKKPTSKARKKVANPAKYPRHSLVKSLRIPLAILEQNAGKECSDRDAAGFVGVSYNGPFMSEIGSAKKFGLLSSPEKQKVVVTDLAKKILRPQSQADEIIGLRESVLKAPDISEVYNHYRGENIPDDKFFENALVDNFKIPREKVIEFADIFFESIEKAKLVEESNGKKRILDVAHDSNATIVKSERIQKLGKTVKVGANDTCFVMMPFADPIGKYYETIYDPAVKKAGLRPVRADNEIFGTGKIIDQIWRGISNAKVLIAELTTRNPNVYYELGLAHALQKPVVLVSSNEDDVPFDLQHIRVIYYNLYDPFWGEKLIEKVAENILSAIKNPEEAIFKYPEEE